MEEDVPHLCYLYKTNTGRRLLEQRGPLLSVNSVIICICHPYVYQITDQGEIEISPHIHLTDNTVRI